MLPIVLAGCAGRIPGAAPLAGVARHAVVVSGVLERGAQPTPAGFVLLRDRGIHTVVDLRPGGETREGERVRGLGLAYVNLPSDAAHPSAETTARFLAVAQDPASQPVFVHCQAGCDRTGTAVAAYRIVAQRWDPDAAIRELRRGEGPLRSAVFAGIPRFLRTLNSRDALAQLGQP